MTIPLTGAGGLFTRLGHLFGGLDDTNAYRGNTAGARVTGNAVLLARQALIQSDYAAGTADYTDIAALGTQVTAQQNQQGGWVTYLMGGQNSVAAQTVITMANLDVPLANKTLAAALQVLIAQMTGVATVQQSVPAAGAPAGVGTPVGDTAIVLSLKNVYGAVLQYVLPETLTVLCTRDSQTGALVNRETFAVTSPVAVTDPLSYLWPGGSGLAGVFTAVDCDQSNDGRNLLINSGFETWSTANYPDNWVTAVGTAGTQFLKSTSPVYRATNSQGTAGACLQIVGDGSTLSELRQPFNMVPSTGAGAGGSSFTLQPNKVYHLAGWYKLSAPSPAAGVLRLALIDGANAVMNDDAATANSVAVTLSGVADANWHSLTGAFRTPKNAATVTTAGNYKLQVKLTTALSNTFSVFLDCLSLTPAVGLYQQGGGPYLSLHSGGTPPLAAGTAPDAWTVAITQTWGGFQKAFDRAFNMKQLGLQLPYAASPTISDALIA